MDAGGLVLQVENNKTTSTSVVFFFVFFQDALLTSNRVYERNRGINNYCGFER